MSIAVIMITAVAITIMAAADAGTMKVIAVAAS
jgi:hypothetical protein